MTAGVAETDLSRPSLPNILFFCNQISEWFMFKNAQGFFTFSTGEFVFQDAVIKC